MMTEFTEWLENINNRSYVVTFDFDSTLTTPVFDPDNELWETVDEPNRPNVQRLRQEVSQGATVFIVSARDDGPGEFQRGGIELFVSKNSLPIKGIYCTGGDKGATLAQLGSIRHYDDMPQQAEDRNGLFQGEWIKVYHPWEGDGVKLPLQ